MQTSVRDHGGTARNGVHIRRVSTQHTKVTRERQREEQATLEQPRSLLIALCCLCVRCVLFSYVSEVCRLNADPLRRLGLISSAAPVPSVQSLLDADYNIVSPSDLFMEGLHTAKLVFQTAASVIEGKEPCPAAATHGHNSDCMRCVAKQNHCTSLLMPIDGSASDAATAAASSSCAAAASSPAASVPSAPAAPLPCTSDEEAALAEADSRCASRNAATTVRHSRSERRHGRHCCCCLRRFPGGGRAVRFVCVQCGPHLARSAFVCSFRRSCGVCLSVGSRVPACEVERCSEAQRCRRVLLHAPLSADGSRAHLTDRAVDHHAEQRTANSGNGKCTTSDEMRRRPAGSRNCNCGGACCGCCCRCGHSPFSRGVVSLRDAASSVSSRCSVSVAVGCPFPRCFSRLSCPQRRGGAWRASQCRVRFRVRFGRDGSDSRRFQRLQWQSRSRPKQRCPGIHARRHVLCLASSRLRLRCRTTVHATESTVFKTTRR